MKKSDIEAKAKNFIKLEKELRNDIKEYLLNELEETNESYTLAVDITIENENDSEFPRFSNPPTVTEMWLDEDNNIIFFVDDTEMYFEELTTYELMCIVKKLED
jgi:hypothetical protein